MPHSSGGGSHGGGSHGGGGGFSSFGSRGSGFRTARTPFPGSMRFVYYHRMMPHYVYSNKDLSEKPKASRFFLLLFYIPFIFGIITSASSAVHHPSKLQNADSRIVITDKANILGSEAQLKATLTSFYFKTGITPAVITVYNESWAGKYQSLEKYAYSLYVNTFADENHWLIVYSTPSEKSGSFEDWYWEGMQGDNTDDILTTTVTASFNNNLQKYFTARSRYSVESAIATAFADLTPTVMKTTVIWPALFFSLVMLGFVCFHAVMMLGLTPKARKMQNALPCPENLTEQDVCEYCGGIYVVGTVTTCPHCGANLKPHSYVAKPAEKAADSVDPFPMANPYPTGTSYVPPITPTSAKAKSMWEDTVDEIPKEKVDER